MYILFLPRVGLYVTTFNPERILFLPRVWTQAFEGRHIRMVDKHIQICATLNNKLYGVLDTTLCD